jgi:hypothetical protein
VERRERTDAPIELFGEAVTPQRARHADRQQAEARPRPHRRHVRQGDGQRLMPEVARRGPARSETEVNALDEHVRRDDRVESRALAEDRGVVADALEEGGLMTDEG